MSYPIFYVGESFYKVEFDRLKSNGVPETSCCYITGRTEVRIFDEYFDCFKPNDRTGRFFRKLKWSFAVGSSIVSTKQVIGKNTTAEYGKVVAGRLGLPNCEGFTGHCWRRTTATIAAGAGLSTVQLKTMTGMLNLFFQLLIASNPFNVHLFPYCNSFSQCIEYIYF
jgi:hypothetical protein